MWRLNLALSLYLSAQFTPSWLFHIIRIDRGQSITSSLNYSLKTWVKFNPQSVHVRCMPPISQTGILGDNCPVIINWVLKNILTLMMNDTNFVAIRKRSALFNHTSDRLCITDKKKVNSWFINQMVNPWTTMQKTSTWSLITHLKPKIKTKKNIKSGILDADSL